METGEKQGEPDEVHLRAASVEEALADSKGREVPPSYASRPLRSFAGWQWAV